MRLYYLFKNTEMSLNSRLRARLNLGMLILVIVYN